MMGVDHALVKLLLYRVCGGEEKRTERCPPQKHKEDGQQNSNRLILDQSCYCGRRRRRRKSSEQEQVGPVAAVARTHLGFR